MIEMTYDSLENYKKGLDGEEIQVIEFTEASKCLNFIKKKIQKKDRVFVLSIISKALHPTVCIPFDASCFHLVPLIMVSHDLYYSLFEFETYEDAFEFCYDVKESETNLRRANFNLN